MKYFVIVVFLATVCEVLSFQSDPYDFVSDAFRSPTVRALSQVIRTNCKNKQAELEEKMNTLKDCYLGIKEKETICSVMRERLMKCVKPVADFMETCLESTKYADMPQFTLETVNSVSSYVCQTKGEKLIELLHPCLVTMGYQRERVCLKSFKQKLSNIDKDDTIINAKTDICKSLERTKSCFLKEFKDSCQNDVTLNSAVGLYDALITKPCKHV